MPNQNGNPVDVNSNVITDARSDFERVGHVGKWWSVVSASAALEVTGSANFGVGSIMTISGTTGTVTLSNGGTVNLAHLTAGVMYDFSVKRVDPSAGAVYLFKRNLKVI